MFAVAPGKSNASCHNHTDPLFASKLALTCDSLVSFGGALDPILKLAVALGQLLDYDVAASDGAAVYDVHCKRDFSGPLEIYDLALNGLEILGVRFAFSRIVDDIER